MTKACRRSDGLTVLVAAGSSLVPLYMPRRLLIAAFMLASILPEPKHI
jgi:hypothetical protein